MPPLKNCPSCNNQVSAQAFDCPTCGHPLRKPRRGVFGSFFKLAFILFNIAMAFWLVSYLVTLGGQIDANHSEAQNAGTVIGGTIGIGILLVIWAVGDIILGFLTVLTRPRK